MAQKALEIARKGVWVAYTLECPYPPPGRLDKEKTFEFESPDFQRQGYPKTMLPTPVHVLSLDGVPVATVEGGVISPPPVSQWRKVAIGLGMALAGAALTYLSTWATGADLGAWTPLVVAALGAAANVVRKVSTGDIGGTRVPVDAVL